MTDEELIEKGFIIVHEQGRRWYFPPHDPNTPDVMQMPYIEIGREGKVGSINDYWDEYEEWLKAHGLHDEEEPQEDTLVGYDEEGEEIYLAADRQDGIVGVDFGFEYWHQVLGKGAL